jgi:SH3 domain
MNNAVERARADVRNARPPARSTPGLVSGPAGADPCLMRRVVAKVAHEIPDRPPLRLSVGQCVDVGDRDTEWPEFVFVTAPQGSGWVPARHLSASSRSAVVRTKYDTTELPTRVGEVLDVVAEDLASGWVWCRSRKGREGWVPLNTLDVGA